MSGAGLCHLRGFLALGDVLRLHALPALGYLVGDLLTLFEGPEPGALYIRVVDENVPAPVIRGDEAVAPVLAEPRYRSLNPVLEPTFPFLRFHRYKSRPLVVARFGNTPRQLGVGR